MAAFFAAGLLLLACLVVGSAALRLCGRDPRAGYGAAVGFAVLVVATSLAIRLPGDDTTSVVLTGLLLVVCAIVARSALPAPPRLSTVLGGVAVALGVSAPFIAVGEVGILGVGINFDM